MHDTATSNGPFFTQSKLKWREYQRTIDAIDVAAHGVSLFQKIDMRFYN